ncbi:MAG: hypothetical protein Q4F95_01145 [Oscillospiraceae bacterium]|nr:hypothetical protein [Oscillospiraceae bacterium]
MYIPKIPDNGLKKEINEIVKLCVQLGPEYGERCALSTHQSLKKRYRNGKVKKV